jgi:hypothetical protein
MLKPIAEKADSPHYRRQFSQEPITKDNPMKKLTPAVWLVTVMLIWAVGTPIVKGG